MFENNCAHENAEPRLRTLSNGTTAVAVQCLRCGVALRCESKAKHNVGALEKFDDSLPIKFQQEKKNEFDLFHADRERNAALKIIAAEEWRAKYHAHLQSEKWRDLRDRVMRRSNYFCEGCAKDTPRHVHHLTYAHLGDELLYELVALCETCHQKIHPQREIKRR